MFIVVVAGGPRVGDMLAGGVTQFLSEGGVLLLGGLLCILVAWFASRMQPGFVAYDAKHPRALTLPVTTWPATRQATRAPT